MNNPTTETISVPRFTTLNHPADILRGGLAAAEGPVALACSFSVEDVVIIDLLQEIAPETRIFALDTGRLNEETYETAEAISVRYGVTIDWYFPEREAVEKLEREKGLFSFRNSLENRKECCRIRKVEPLQRALKGLDGWITGMRRGQGATRGEIEPLEIDTAHGGIIKINPLAFWSAEKVWAYAKQRHIPVNRLHRQGYPSIGCAPCTRAIEPGEDERAGRWWWESPEHKECGLHSRSQ
ncbi:phosphoadenylyl-sulfate reductase [Geoalkalibacter subterraneus]|uniref:Adenosine 5'-phosphosulfate reductase n=1 Tax=Geoalkalibacter subterraneus TaxID=483547 RepID=A0A0B5FNQ0_9BACT|nr:phosphoadenylyl-sulfate reductase [Geoalkalibacter subterraneus]AJF05655.1 adenylylsulfate reductase [Geoalkalibacter subterraneus]